MAIATAGLSVLAEIVEMGNDEVDVNTTDLVGNAVTARYFRTSAARESASKAVRDEASANDKYR
jgi:hypothetical protein